MKQSRFVIRIVTSLCLFILVPIIPWWGTSVLLLIAIFIFDSYYEALIVGIFLDEIYGAPLAVFGSFHFLFFLYTALLIITTFFLKKRLSLTHF